MPPLRSGRSDAMRLSAQLRRVASAVMLAASLPVLAVGSLDASKHPDWDLGVAAIQTREWSVAITHLQSVVRGEPNNADAHNWLGYAYRNSGKLDLAFKHYNDALRLDPSHRGAHEYIGEAYLMVGNTAKAKEHLAALERLCGKTCEEYRDLEKALAAAK